MHGQWNCGGAATIAIKTAILLPLVVPSVE